MKDLMQKLAAQIVAKGISMAALAAAVEEIRAKGAPRRDKLIATQAQAERAGAGKYRVKKAEGLYLKKGESGSGSWFRRYWINGRRREMGLGSLGKVTLVEAINKAGEFAVQYKAGNDPLDLKRGATASGDKWIFETATKEYLKAHAPSWKHPRARQVWFSPIEKYAYPVIGKMLLDDIKVGHVDAVMTAAVQGGAPAVAPRIRLRIEQIINAAIAKGKRNADLPNPASGKLIKAVRPTRDDDKRENFRRIELADAPAAFRKLQTLAANSTMLSALVFMIATATRPSEALGAKWSEIKLDAKLWTVPTARMKGGKEHVVPLSPVALAVLDRQDKVRVSDAVFPGIGSAPVSYGAFSAAVRALEFDVGTPHSWRSIFRDAAEDICGYRRETVEAALAHSLGKVEAAYRRETAVETRRPMMAAYADWLTESNVIELKRA
jgi:integrase